MSGVLPRYQLGPVSYPVSAAVKGGQLVAADSVNPGQVKVAVAGDRPLGVALVDAQPAADQSGNTTDYGAPVVDVSVPGTVTSVAYGGFVVPVTYSTAAVFGDLLQADAAGAVKPWVPVTDTDATLIVGRCDEPAGVAAGATGRMRTA